MGKEKTIVLDTMEKLKKTVDLFYQQIQKEALDSLNVVIGEIMKAMDELFAYKAANQEFEMDEERLTNSLKECMGAIEAADYILVADIFQYDFIEYMEELAEQMD